MAGNNGIQLPISLQISNLQDVANQIKQFANKNVLADSLGGKKIDSELGKILSRLEQISAKAKTAFTTQADFSSVQKEVNQVELSLNKVQNAIKNLGFDELKIPEEFSGQIAALQGRIRELNSSLATFKGTQKEKLVSNVDFMADLQKADPKQAAKWLEKGYDELQKAIDEGMTKVNTILALKAAEYQDKQKLITQNSTGKVVSTQLGALSFIQEAFKALPKDDKARNTAQAQMASFMKATADESGKMEFSGFKQGARGLNDFLKYIADSYSFTPEQMTQIRARLKEQVQELAKEGQKITQTDVIKSMSSNEGLAKKILFGDNAKELELAANKYANDIRDAQKILQEKVKLEDQQGAFMRLQVAFDVPNREIEQKAAEIAAALKVPTEALQGFELQILSAATSSPQLAALFQRAAGEIATLNNAVEQGKQKLQSIDNAIGKMQGISNFVNRYVGLYAIVRRVTTAVKNAMSNIKDIDKAITSIAVVTNMTQEDLWGKIGEYTQMAQQYGVATKEVYTVSQIFYQQGLQTAQVMSLTTETLKMAKIAGIDYSTAANAMTVAVRAFKLEMTEAQAVTDTYSALAAKFAVSSAEIANAMEKTASSAASVGMSLQSTSAFISVMEQTTRESAQNIGSALKSIISRYGEMKASPEKLLNVEGEDVAFNKVDTALKSIGISIKDASGQFRDFDDVIMELASKWDSLDNNTQRYIATIMAGNRQQSRFIALVSNYDELSRAMDVANNAENASIVQVAKTMDSLETKAQQLKNAFSQIYLDLHAEEGLKSMYDWLTRILKTIGKLGVLKGVLPTLMNIIGIGTGVKKIANIGMQTLQQKKSEYQVQTDKAMQDIEKVRARASEEIKTQWKIEADLSQLEAAKTATSNLATQNMVQMAQTMKANDAYFSLSNFRNVINDARQNGTLLTGEGRLATLEKLGVTNENSTEEYRSQLDGFLQAIGQASQQAQQFGQTLDSIKNSGEQASQGMDKVGQTGTQASTNLNNLSNSANNVGASEINKVSAAEQAAQADLNKATQARIDIEQEIATAQKKLESSSTLTEAERELTQEHLKSQQALLTGAKANEDAARAALAKAQADNESENADRREAIASDEAANADSRKAGSGNGKSDAGGIGGIGKYNSTLMKGIGIASGVARLAGTAVVAAGAAHQDKSTDKVETSKMLTGVGNGLSMAGTGASMGMTFGPWGAAIGGLVGLLTGGLGAFIDGLHHTVGEKLALLEDEVEISKNDSLKKQAKVIDLKSSIDNIKALQATMYNSTDDMQKYKEAMNSLADTYPELVSAYDAQGNAIIDLNAAENLLAQTRVTAANSAREYAISNANLALKSKEALLLLQEELDKVEPGKSNINTSASGGFGHTTIKNPWLVRNGNGTEEIEGFEETGYSYQGGFARVTLPYKDELNRLYDEIKENAELMHSLNITSENFNEITLDEVRTLAKYASEKGFGNKISTTNWQSYYEQVSNKASSFTYDSVKQPLINILNDYKDTDLFGGETDPTKIWNWSSQSPTWNEVSLALDDINSKIDVYEKKVQNLRGIASNSLGQRILYKNSLISELQPDQLNNLQNNSIYSQLFTEILKSKTPKNYENLIDWQQGAEAEFTTESGIVSQWFIDWYKSLTDAQKQILESLDFSAYNNVNDIMSKLGLEDDKNSDVYKALESRFIEVNKENKNKILEAIYNTDIDAYSKVAEIRDINPKLKGLNHLASDDSSVTGQVSNIVQRLTKGITIDKTTYKINDQYSDFFKNQLLEVNNLAEEGYTELANNQLTILNSFSNSLSRMTSQQQQDMFKIVTNIDFSSYDSIQSAIKNIDEYAEKNNILDISKDKNFGRLYESLTTAAQSLLFNVNTLAQEVTATITSASDKMDSIISTNKSGLSFDKALEEFTNLQAQFSEITNFDQVFSYDAVLGKYVYTQDGLAKAIQAQEQKLNDQVTQLSETAKIYTEQITQNGHMTGGIESLGSKTYIKSEDLYKDLLGLIAPTTDPKIKAAYEKLSKEYIDSLEEGKIATGAGFRRYVEQQVQEISKQATDAQILLNEFQANKKNQYYQAIDWSKLALGTDFSGTNKELMQSLAQELGMTKQTGVDENGKAIFAKYTGTWEEVLNKYLEQTYSDESARQVAKTAIEGQIKQQKSQSISTAISEVLQGAGNAISEGTAAILEEQGKLNLIDENGLLKSGEDFVQSALDIFNTTKDKFTTLGEKNKAYTEVLNAEFAKANAGKNLLSSGNTLDLNAIESSFTALGLDFETLYTKDENGKYGWNEGFENVLTTDIFGRTTIKNWIGFVDLLKEKGIEIGDATSAEYQKWYNAYIDAQISEAESVDPYKIASTQISNVSTAKVGTVVNVNDLSPVIKQALNIADDATTYKVLSEYYRDSQILQIDAAKLSMEEGRAEIVKMQNEIRSKRAKNSAISGIAQESFGRDAFRSFFENTGKGDTSEWTNETLDAWAEYYGFIWNELTQSYETTEKGLETIDSEIANLNPATDQKKIDELRIQREKLETQLNTNRRRDVLNSILSSYDNITKETLDEFQGLFGNGYDQYFETDATGKTALKDFEGLMQALKETYGDIFNKYISSIADSYIDNAAKATSLITSGTSSFVEMEAFTKSYNKTMKLENDAQKTSADLFSYNKTLQGWTLDPSVLKAYVQAQADALKEAGKLDPKDVDAWIKNQTSYMLASEVNISDYLSADDRGVNGQAYKQIKEQMTQYYMSIGEARDDAQKHAVQEINSLNEGGDAAVRVVQRWAQQSGRDATGEEIQAAYANVVNQLQEAMDSLADVSVGQLVTGKLKSYLQRAGKADAKGVVTSVEGMVDVYQLIYDDMKKTAGKTTAGLNEAYAKLLTAGEQKDIDTLEALENASGMTYDALGQILAKYNVSLEDFMNKSDNGITKAGFGKIKITDFDAFIKASGLSNLDKTSAEYMEVYAKWVDSRVDFENQNKQLVQDAVDELKGLTEAKSGQSINISHLESVMGDGLTNIVEKYGATLNQGLLKISDDTDIPSLINAIADVAERTGKMIPEQLAELADAVQEMLSKITSLVKGGISGSLSNSDAASLQTWATKNGMEQLDFVKTAEGLKLSEQSAIALYNTLSKVDALQASLVFDDLADSLIASNDHFKDTEALLNHVNNLRNDIYATDGKTSTARQEQYKAELDIAEKILMTRSSAADESYKFMNKAIPAGQNNPLDYMASWADAFEKMKATKKGGKDSQGLMEYTDFYNIITEMGHIAELSGQAITLGKETVANSTQAADLITKAAGALKVTSDGKMKVDLSGIGVEFATSADKMSADVNKGIDTLAQAQIDMLDSMIKVLEVVVAMEDLGDIDLDKNGIDLEDIFVIKYDENGQAKEIEGLEANYADFRDKIVKKITEGSSEFNKDLADAMSSVSINGKTLASLLQLDEKGWKEKSVEEAKAFSTTLAALYKASLSDNFNLDDITSSVYDVLRDSGLDDLSIDVGTKTFYIKGGVTSCIDWSDKEVVASAEKAFDKYILDHKGQFTKLGKDPSIQEKVFAIQKLLDSNKIEAKSKVDIEWQMKLLTGEIKISEEKDKKGKKTYTGTYKGKTFTNASKEEVEKAIQEALALEDKGLSFNVKNDENGITVNGYKNINGAKITLQTVDGKDQYYYKGTPYKTLEEAIAAAVSQGYTDKDIAGKKYEVKDKNKKVHKLEAKYNSRLDVGYSIDTTTNKVLYKGKKFPTQEALFKYIEEAEPLLKDGDWGKPVKDKKDNNLEITVNSENGAVIKRNLKTGEILYEIDGITFKDVKAFGEYVARKEAADEKDMELTGPDKVINFVQSGYTVTMTTTSDGHIEYVVNMGSKGTFTATSEAGLKAALAAAASLDDADTTITSEDVSGEKGIAFTYTNSEGVTVQAKFNGEVTSTDPDNAEAKKVVTAAKEALQSGVTAETSATGIDAELSKVNVSAAEVDVTTVGDQIVKAIQTYLDEHPVTPTVSAGQEGSADNSGNTGGADVAKGVGIVTQVANTLNTITPDTINAIKDTASEIPTDKIVAVKDTAGEISADNVAAIEEAQSKIKHDKVDAIAQAEEGISTSSINAVQQKLNNLTAKVTTSVTGSNAEAGLTVKVKATTAAKGNIGALAKGNTAMASGTKTLMGELGPELVVSNGRYFLAGQYGAEFVDLANDAIVFNHKQTERLLAQGGIGSRGVPFTNETNAISYAKGNVSGPALEEGTGTTTTYSIKDYYWTANVSRSQKFKVADIVVDPSTSVASAKGTVGPAMASASAALAALKQLRSMWQSLQAATAKDLAGLGGSSGGGGGKNNAAFIKQLEKWYNWLQEIAKQEEKINYQEKLRAKLASDNIKNGKAYYASQKKSLESLKSELSTTRDLVTSQQQYFNQRRSELNSDKNPFSSLYTFDESGQLKYKDGKLQELSNMVGTNKYGNPNMTPQKQYEYITKTLGIDSKYLQFDSSGNEIEYNTKKVLDEKTGKYKTVKTTPKDNAAYQAAVQAFWDKIDADKEEMQSLHDSINEYSQKALEIQQAQNELLQEMQDNQMDLENEILDAVIEGRQREIDKLSDLKNAYSDASSKMISGLNEALSKEQDKYSKNQEDAELLQLRRRLAMVQRSGGSASEIASLQEQIRSKSQDAYFNEQQRQIDELQKAADEQIERMDIQIDILTQTLDYQKKNGLLWTDVYEVMKKSPREIADFLQKNTEDYWGKSTLAQSETADDWFFKAEQWAEFRDDNSKMMKQLKAQGKTASDQDVADFKEAMGKTYSGWNKLTDKQKNLAVSAFQKAYAETGDFKAATDQVASDFSAKMGRADKWKAENEKYKKKYGKYWTDEIASKVQEAYISGGTKKATTAIAESALWKRQKNSKTGQYEAIAVKASDKVTAVTQAAAQQSADQTNARISQELEADWAAFGKSEGARWATLTDEQKTKFKKIYETAYRKASNNNRSTAASNALVANKEFIEWQNGKKAKVYAAKQNSKNFKWTVVELTEDQQEKYKGKTPHGNKASSYNSVAADVEYNNAQYKAYKNGKIKTPKYKTRYKYDIGGMVQETGTALLHAKESVLTAAQTDILRNDILGRNKNSLLNLLLDFKKAYNNIGNQIITTEPSIVIENASVNMNIDEIANDYDARRAGEQALSEMLKIARKTGAASTLRR